MASVTNVANQKDDLPIILTRKGAIDEISQVMSRLGAARTIIVVGPGLRQVAERVHRLLGHRSAGSFSDTVAHVPAKEVNLAVASAQEAHIDSVLSIGGGSTAGYAKIIALALRVPWIAVPTSLSGAEMTGRYFVTTANGKEDGRSPLTIAQAVLRDPDLLELVPERVLVSSGLGAIAACVDLLATVDEDAYAADALPLLWEALPILLTDPGDSEARLRALRGAELAGRALDSMGPGPVQLVAEALGARHRCDHGHLMAELVVRTRHDARLPPDVGDGGPAGLELAAYMGRLGDRPNLDHVLRPDGIALNTLLRNS